MNNRPVLKLPLSKSDKIMECLAGIALAVLWIYPVISYSALPETIPVHFNLRGDIDNYGKKATIWGLPVIATAIYTGMTILNRYPHVFNYLSTITVENAERQYRTATRMLRWLKMIVLFVLLTVTAEVIITARNGRSFTGIWLIVIFVMACTVPIAVSLIISSRKATVKP